MSEASHRQPAGAGAALFGLTGLLRERRRHLALTVLSGLLAQGGTIGTLAVGARLVGRALAGTPPAGLIAGFCLFAVVATAAALARWWQAHISHDLAFALIETLQMGIYDGLERAAPGLILGRRTGDLAAIATGDAEMMEHFYAHTLADYVAAAVIPVAALAGLAFIHPPAAAAVLALLLLLASVPYWFAPRADEQGRIVAEELGALNAEAVEFIQGLRELAAFRREDAFIGKLLERARRLGDARKRYALRAGLEAALIDAVAALAVLVAAWLLLAEGAPAPAELPLVLVLAGAALMPAADVSQTARKFGELRAGAGRILAIMRQRPQVADRGSAPAPPDTTVRFEQVVFGYGGGRGKVLDGLDLELRAGEIVALTGRSGVGKTTAGYLLMRFWDVDAGRITIGGRDIRDLPLAGLRALVAYVPQDACLFAGSIAENIRLGRPAASAAEIEAAARLAQAHEFISRLPQGYDTDCGARGAALSGGQRQRIAIARALVTRAPILLLDEASSDLDPETEQALRGTLDALRGRRTVLAIAHRRSTIRAADRVVHLGGA